MRWLFILPLIGVQLCMAQSFWLHEFDEPVNATVGDVQLDDDGNPIVLLTFFDELPVFDVVKLSQATGIALNSGTFSFPGRKALGSRILGSTANGDILILGNLSPSSPGGGDSSNVGLFRASPDLEQLGAWQAGQAGKFISFSVGLLHTDSTVRVAYQTYDESFSNQQFKALTMDLEGNELLALELVDVAATPSIGSLSLLSNGHVLLASTAAFFDTVTWTSAALQVYDSDWSALSTQTLPMVDPSTQLIVNGPRWPLYALVLPSGNVVASSYYWKCFCEDQRTVAQKVTPNGILLEQWTTDSPYEKDLPARIRAVDYNGTHIFFARLNNWRQYGHFSDEASQIEVFKMDTSLNVLETYLLDGFPDNTYYLPAAIKATPEGDVYISGTLQYLNMPGSLLRGWVAKIGADSFVSVNERSKPSANLYPNPGAEGFQLVLGEPVTNGRLELFDMQGKLVHVEAFQGANGQITIPGLPAGMYCVTLRDASGATMLQQRWVKQ